ncbi:hypothetical protein [Crossiella sp. CA198]|uniref:hypothetical protein n=1 Tax=Crossiella sp. CA198 TaxID=3455607 RepID=UPI003F8D0484
MQADTDRNVYRIQSPHLTTYCDGNEPHDERTSVWFVEGVAYLPLGHPKARYYSEHSSYTVERVPVMPVHYPAAAQALRQAPARIGLPLLDAADPAFRTREAGRA